MLRSLDRYLPWIGGGLLAIGTAAVLIALGQRSVKPEPADNTNVALQIPKKEKRAPVDPTAQKIAGQFIQTAVARRNLDSAWKITHPELRMGMSLREWRTGAIPVQPLDMDKYDAKQIAFRTTWSFSNDVLLEVFLVPKAGVKGVDPQTFYIGLKAKGKGKARRWLVNYWMTSYKPPVRPDPATKG